MALTKKQERFIDEYFAANLNATEAAFRVYQPNNRVTAASIGYENLRKLVIAEKIEARLAEETAKANEVLYRLAEIARADCSDFVGEDGMLSVKSIKAGIKAGRGYIIRRFRVRKTAYGQEILLQLHDAQAALIMIGRHHGLFTGKRQTELGKDKPEKLSDKELAMIAIHKSLAKVLNDSPPRQNPVAQTPSVPPPSDKLSKLPDKGGFIFRLRTNGFV